MTLKSILEFCGRLRRHGEQAPLNKHGNTITRLFHSTDRYRVDFADHFREEGWEQFDTDQDASYFGVWVNRLYLITLTYAEGDWTLCDCPDDACYLAEVESMINCYGEGFIAKAIEKLPPVVHPAGLKVSTTHYAAITTTYRQDRAVFLKPWAERRVSLAR